MADQTRSRFTFIDGLRGMAAMLVCLFHALRGNHLDIVSTDLVSLVVLGEAGVVIFFVVSGFVITYSISRAGIGPGSVGPYVLQRAIRLDPPYWVAIILASGLSLLASMVFPDRPLPDYTAGQFVAHIFYMQELLGYKHINPVFWTLCYEVQFYVVIACLLAVRSPAVLAVTFAASLLWPLQFAPQIQGLFVNFFYAFLLGVGVFHTYRRPSLAPWFLAYGTIIFGCAIVNEDPFALISSLTAAVLLLVAMRDKLGTWLNWRWLQLLGMISYSLYLTHNPVTGAVFRIWFMIAGHSPASQVIGLALSVVASVIFAWFIYMLIEKPCIAMARSSRNWHLPATLRRVPRPKGVSVP